MMKEVIKRDGSVEAYNSDKIINALDAAFKACNYKETPEAVKVYALFLVEHCKSNKVEDIQDAVENAIMTKGYYDVAKAYILYREKHKAVRDFVQSKTSFIDKYKQSANTADASIDDNSNVGNKNIAVLNTELYKENNIDVNRGRVMAKLKELYPEFDAKQYVRDLKHHIIYKNDENSTFGFPYCVAISMYPFLTNGIKDLGGLSAAPKNLDSFCGMFVNMIFAISSQYAGAVATPEFLLCFDYFARKEFGEDYYKHLNDLYTKKRSIISQIHQHFQNVTYSINQPSAARGFQSAFVNFAFFDKPFFDNMFEEFKFPDGTAPVWDSFNWLQKEYLHWLNQERLKCILTFPVTSVSLLYKDGEFKDKDMYEFVCKEYAEGNSFFTYMSDTVDSLSSCCFTKDTKVLWKTSTDGVHLTTLEELHNLKWEPTKKNLRIFHNGSWVRGKSIKLPNRHVYKVVTENNKEFYMTDNHINVTLNGEKSTLELTTDDYLMFNTQVLQAVPENDEHLTYEMGFVVGAFLGDGSFGGDVKGTIYDINFSQNITKYKTCIDNINKCAEQLGIETRAKLSSVYNNVYPVRISSKELVAFIQRWTLWERGTYAHNKKLNLNCLLQSVEFRKGILEGWYNTDGGNSNRCYTSSKELAEDMEALLTSLGLNSIIDVSDRTEEKIIIRGEEYNRNYPLYCVRWYEPANHRINKDFKHTWIKKNNSIYFKIKSIEQIAYSDDVYCIECNNSIEPYFTLPSGLITHNCRLKNKVGAREFNYTNGNMSVMTGSKSVITLNLNRIIQDWYKTVRFRTYDKSTSIGKSIDEALGVETTTIEYYPKFDGIEKESLKAYLVNILERVYKYHTAYNELLWDMYNANLLPVYKAGFVTLNKQYLTVGINGLTAAADFLGIEVSDNEEYKEFCHLIFSTIKEQNQLHKTTKTMFNTEQIPAESCGVKLYNYDKEDGYYVPEDINLYTSYMFKPYDAKISVLKKLKLHGNDYIGDFMDGGAAAHINLAEHPSYEQYLTLLDYAAKIGCQYFTFNIPNCECDDCGFIAKQPFTVCPKCGSTHVSLWDRVIGYLTKIKNWSEARREEQKLRVYSNSKIKNESKDKET